MAGFVFSALAGDETRLCDLEPSFYPKIAGDRKKLRMCCVALFMAYYELNRRSISPKEFELRVNNKAIRISYRSIDIIIFDSDDESLEIRSRSAVIRFIGGRDGLSSLYSSLSSREIVLIKHRVTDDTEGGFLDLFDVHIDLR